MTDKERKKLNDKLLEFAGFRKDGEFRVVGPAPSHKVIPTPDFTDPELGIAHCFKWLVPKFRYYGIGTNSNGKHGAIVQAENYRYFNAQSDMPNMAICLAVIEAIDAKAD